MPGIEETIDVDVPAERAYEVWADFPGYTRFVKGVRRLRRTGDELHWEAKAGPKSLEWTARIVAEEPGSRLAWEAPEGPIDTDITFEALGPDRTRVVFRERMHDSLPAEVTAALGAAGSRARDDLKRYKDLAEGRDPDPLGSQG